MHSTQCILRERKLHLKHVLTLSNTIEVKFMISGIRMPTPAVLESQYSDWKVMIKLLVSQHEDLSIVIQVLVSQYCDPSIRIQLSGSQFQDPNIGIQELGSQHLGSSIGIPVFGFQYWDPSIGIPVLRSNYWDPSIIIATTCPGQTALKLSGCLTAACARTGAFQQCRTLGHLPQHPPCLTPAPTMPYPSTHHALP